MAIYKTDSREIINLHVVNILQIWKKRPKRTGTKGVTAQVIPFVSPKKPKTGKKTPPGKSTR